MASLKEIKKELETIKTIKEITSIYYEIANLRMKEIKESVLKNRAFFDELIKTYQRIRTAFVVGLKKRAEEVIKEKEKKNQVLVFLSANEFLYGSLILDVWKEIQGFFNPKRDDLVVIGRIGKYLVERSRLKKFYYFELDDAKPEVEKIGQIVELIKNYQKILVFHGKYMGGLIQKPIAEEISPALELKRKIREKRSYIFEPSPEEIFDFFESEILGILLNITLLEHHLARLAARVVSMSEATEKAKKIEKELLKKELKIKRQLLTKKQIEIFSKI